ncbi:MAG: hypothetical protein ACAI34_00125, partial [Verrucomicrobium sp.]
WPPGALFTLKRSYELEVHPILKPNEATAFSHASDLVFLKFKTAEPANSAACLFPGDRFEENTNGFEVLGYDAGRLLIASHEDEVIPSPHPGWRYINYLEGSGSGVLAGGGTEPIPGASGGAVFRKHVLVGLYRGGFPKLAQHVFMLLPDIRRWCLLRGYTLVSPAQPLKRRVALLATLCGGLLLSGVALLVPWLDPPEPPPPASASTLTWQISETLLEHLNHVEEAFKTIGPYVPERHFKPYVQTINDDCTERIRIREQISRTRAAPPAFQEELALLEFLDSLNALLAHTFVTLRIDSSGTPPPLLQDQVRATAQTWETLRIPPLVTRTEYATAMVRMAAIRLQVLGSVSGRMYDAFTALEEGPKAMAYFRQSHAICEDLARSLAGEAAMVTKLRRNRSTPLPADDAITQIQSSVSLYHRALAVPNSPWIENMIQNNLANDYYDLAKIFFSINRRTEALSSLKEAELKIAEARSKPEASPNVFMTSAELRASRLEFTAPADHSQAVAAAEEELPAIFEDMNEAITRKWMLAKNLTTLKTRCPAFTYLLNLHPDWEQHLSRLIAP